MDDVNRWSGVFLLLSCCRLSWLTVWQIQFGCFAACWVHHQWAGALGGKCEAAAGPHCTGWNIHTMWKGLLSCVGHFFHLDSFPSDTLSLLFSQLLPSWEKRSVLKHVLNITIFIFSCFKKGAKWECVLWICFSFFFSLFFPLEESLSGG